jgi:CRISPR/Cas system-associated exonuclease Cas4 (RecB family)
MPKRTTKTKPSGQMAAFAATQKAKTSLLGDIQAHAVKKAAQDHSRRQDIIHPSEMAKTDVCPRSIVYRLSGVTPTEDKDPNGHHLETIFQEGHNIHSKWQTWLQEMGRLWGKWRCTACGTEEWGLSSDLPEDDSVYASPDAPGACDPPSHRHVWEYREIPLDAEEEMSLVGHADGGVPDIESMIEVKSIGLGTLRMEEPELVRENTVKTEAGKSIVDYDSVWRNLKRPLRSHRIQAGIYLKIAALKGWPFTKMIFIYENKANQQTKEFTIKYPEDLVDPIIETIKDIKWAVEKGHELDRPEGFTRKTKPCRTCVFRTHCWGEEQDEDDTTQQDAPDGARVSRSQAEVGPAKDSRAASAKGRLPRSSRGSDRTRGRRTDDAVHDDHQVVGVPKRAEGDVRGRRTVRRSRPRQDQVDQGA